MIMQAIWKFPLTCADKGIIAMPKGAKVLCVQTQLDEPQIWAVCNIGAEKEDRTFAIYGTGHVHESIGGEYVGTFQMRGGSLVFHVFEEGKHKICPRCSGRLSTDSGFDVCDDCGFDG